MDFDVESRDRIDSMSPIVRPIDPDDAPPPFSIPILHEGRHRTNRSQVKFGLAVFGWQMDGLGPERELLHDGHQGLLSLFSLGGTANSSVGTQYWLNSSLLGWVSCSTTVTV